MQEKCKENTRKIQNASLTQENVSILHYVWAKTRVNRVLLAFCLRFAHKVYQTQRIV